MLNRWIGSALASAALLVSAGAHAARDFTPQAGTWVISEELDGKPGRGLAIDVQGNTFFMQVFGYEKNGDATFYTATGTMDGDSVTAPLMRYAGGRSFGGAARDAVEDQSLGNVTMSFSNGLAGTIQLPGEPARAMRRLEVMSPAFEAGYLSPAGGGRDYLAVALDDALQPALALNLTVEQSRGKRYLAIRDFALGFFERLECTRVATAVDMVSCTPDPAATVPSYAMRTVALVLRIAGADAAGYMDVQSSANAPVQRYRVQAISVSGVRMPTGATIGCPQNSLLYTQDVGTCIRDSVQVPANGTWIMQDELTGRPGRGMALDVQNGMAIAQVFNYQPSGQATFHMGSAAFDSMQPSIPLQQYGSGRTVGGPLQSAQQVASAGDLQMDFVVTADEFDEWDSNRVQAQAALPHEGMKRMMRLALEPDATRHQGLLGQWMMRFKSPTQNEEVGKFVSLTRDVGDAAVSDDGTVRCERKTQGPSYFFSIACIWSHPAGNGLLEPWTTRFSQQTNNRSAFALQIRDRHGNLLGFGKLE